MMRCDLLRGDYLELLEDIQDESIDLVLTDPPYGCSTCEWDKTWDVGGFFSEAWRVLKPTGTMAIFGDGRCSHEWYLHAKKYWKYDLLWVKKRGCNFIHAKNMPMKNVEFISVFSRGAIAHRNRSNRMTYNPQGIQMIHQLAHRDPRKKMMSVAGYRPSHKSEWIQEAAGYPTLTVYFPTICEMKRCHPFEKPTDLLAYLIQTFSNPNETILDPFMGSGSTGVAAIQAGRNFIGMELNEKYYEIAKSRIDNVLEKEHNREKTDCHGLL